MLALDAVQIFPSLIGELLEPFQGRLPGHLDTVISGPGPGTSTWQAGALNNDEEFDLFASTVKQDWSDHPRFNALMETGMVMIKQIGFMSPKAFIIASCGRILI